MDRCWQSTDSPGYLASLARTADEELKGAKATAKALAYRPPWKSPFQLPRRSQLLAGQVNYHLPGKDIYPAVAGSSLSHPQVHQAFYQLPKEPVPATAGLRKDHRYP